MRWRHRPWWASSGLGVLRGLCELGQLKRERSKRSAPAGASVAFGRGAGPVRVRVGGREGVLFLAVEVVLAIRSDLVRLVLRRRAHCITPSRSASDVASS